MENLENLSNKQPNETCGRRTDTMPGSKTHSTSSGELRHFDTGPHMQALKKNQGTESRDSELASTEEKQ